MFPATTCNVGYVRAAVYYAYNTNGFPLRAAPNALTYEGGYNATTGARDFTTILYGYARTVQGQLSTIEVPATTAPMALRGFSTISASSALGLTGSGVTGDVHAEFDCVSGDVLLINAAVSAHSVEVRCTYGVMVGRACSVTNSTVAKSVAVTFKAVAARMGTTFFGATAIQNFLDFETMCIYTESASTRSILSPFDGRPVYVNHLRTGETPATILVGRGMNQGGFINASVATPRGGISIKNTTYTFTTMYGTFPHSLWVALPQVQGTAVDKCLTAGALAFVRVPTTRPGGAGSMWRAAGVELPYLSTRSEQASAWQFQIAQYVVRAGETITIRAWVMRSWTAALSVPHHGISVTTVQGITPALAKTIATGNGASGVWEQLEIVLPPRQACVLEVSYFVYVRTSSAGTRSVQIDQITCEQS
jgi:hypothetical protein